MFMKMMVTHALYISSYNCKIPKILKTLPRYSCLFHGVYRMHCSVTDGFLEHLCIEEGCKRENIILKYFECTYKEKLKETMSGFLVGKTNETLHKNNIAEIVCFIEDKFDLSVFPNKNLNYLMIYFAKSGNISGVKAIQIIMKKYNFMNYFKKSEYKHFLAEAYWIDGKIQASLQLFSEAYENSILRPKVRVMIIGLFPLLTEKHSEVMVSNTINSINKFSSEKNDFVVLAYLWKELFQSTWFTDQQQAQKLLQHNLHLFQFIKWMLPSLGKKFLRDNKVDDYYRLIQLTLENNCKESAHVLLQLLFDYYYVQKNIERCSAVVKYAVYSDLPLTEEQQRRYIYLLLRIENGTSPKINITKPKPQNLRLKF